MHIKDQQQQRKDHNAWDGWIASIHGQGYDDQYYPPTPKPDPKPDGVLCGISIKIKGECLADIISRVPYKLLRDPGSSFRCLRD